MYMQEMVNDALNRHVSFEQQDNSRLEESPNEATQRFYRFMRESKRSIKKQSQSGRINLCNLLAS